MQATKKLSEVKIRDLKPLHVVKRYGDGAGLYLEVKPNGSKIWSYIYRQGTSQHTLSLGKYPTVTLKTARGKAEDMRIQRSGNVDPAEKIRSDKLERKLSQVNTFEAVAREYLQKQANAWELVTHTKATALLETWAFPWIGSRPIADITSRELLETVLRRVESFGKLETAHRLKQRCSQIFRYAIAIGAAVRDPTPDLKGALSSPTTRHHPAIVEPLRVGELIRAIETYAGSLVTRAALRLSALFFVRPGELRHAEWAEFDLDGAHPQWSIPAKKMKMDAPHIVPLSTQAIAILRELRSLTGAGRYVFHGLHNRQRPMCENTVNGGLQRLGFEPTEMVAHGFRTTASTLLNEQGWSPDIIETQLAHAERNEVRRAYNRAKYLPQRREMMQSWADYLDGLRDGRNIVVPIKRSA